jgi:hypothetical protein
LDQKFKNLVPIYKKIEETIESVHKTHERFATVLLTNLNNSLNQIEKTINSDLKEIINDKNKLNNLDETGLKGIILSFEQNYDKHLRNVKVCVWIFYFSLVTSHDWLKIKPMMVINKEL